jgi:glycosyltransferase involved in cell wall biosynthesis
MAEPQLMTATADGEAPLAPCAWDRDITFFVACYNEEENIVATLDTLTGALAEVNCTWEIIVIDDGSKDRSAELIQRYIQEHAGLPIRLVVNRENKGLAQNYIEAAFLGRGKYYRLVCGDNAEPKETFVTLLRHLGDADMIIPYQVECRGKSRFRRDLSKMYTGLVNAISGHRIRYYNGLPIHLRFHVMRWHTNYRGFGFQADMVTRLLDEGFSYIEVPVVAQERAKGHSKALTCRNLFSVAHTLLDLFIRRVGRATYRANGVCPGGQGGEGAPATLNSASNGYRPAQAQEADRSAAHSPAGCHVVR